MQCSPCPHDAVHAVLRRVHELESPPQRLVVRRRGAEQELLQCRGVGGARGSEDE